MFSLFTKMRRPHVKVNITTNDDCQERALGGVKIESSMLCAGGDGTGSGQVSKDNHLFQFPHLYMPI